MKIYKLDPNPKKYVRPGSRQLSQAQLFRRYVAKRKFEIALGEYQKRQRFYRRRQFFREYGLFVLAAIMAAVVALLVFLQHLGVPGF